MFPVFSTAARKLLLLPIGTENVERSFLGFSTMNRILTSQRCRLLPAHACQLMQLSIEGLQVPHVRNASDDEEQAFTDMIDRAYKLWLTHPRRGRPINC